MGDCQILPAMLFLNHLFSPNAPHLQIRAVSSSGWCAIGPLANCARACQSHECLGREQSIAKTGHATGLAERQGCDPWLPGLSMVFHHVFKPKGVCMYCTWIVFDRYMCSYMWCCPDASDTQSRSSSAGTDAYADSQCRMCIEFVQRAAAGMRPKKFCKAIPGISAGTSLDNFDVKRRYATFCLSTTFELNQILQFFANVCRRL